MVKYAHPSVVDDLDTCSGDSYGVGEVLDTHKTSQIPLPTSFLSKNPTTIPVVPKISNFRGPKHRHVVEFFRKYFTHNLPLHYTNDHVTQNGISTNFKFSIIPPIVSTMGRYSGQPVKQAMGPRSSKYHRYI